MSDLETLKEMAAFHRAVAASTVNDFDDARIGATAREIHATHTRYAETLEALVNANLQPLQICQHGK